MIEPSKMPPKSGHGGDVYRLARDKGIPVSDIIDFSSNPNPLGPPSWLRDVLSSAISHISHYPDPACTGFIKALSKCFDVSPETLIPCNGTSELIYALPRVVERQQALIPSPAYIDYRRAALLAGLQVEELVLSDEHNFQPDLEVLDKKITPHHLVFLGQPANPTGVLCDPSALRALAEQHPKAVFVIDEAYIDFIEGGSAFSLRSAQPDNVIVLYSMTKTFSIPGLRLGAGFASAPVARRLREHMAPWNVNALAQAVGEKALFDADYIERTTRFVNRQREHMAAELRKIPGLRVYPSQANYLLLRSDRPGLDAKEIAAKLLDHRLLVRNCDNYTGLDSRYFRLAVKNKGQTERLLAKLRTIFGKVPAQRKPSKRAAAIMVQGTNSNAGKSILCAALCRIFKQEGYRVAPFKAQNMSLNSHVTLDGGEMGRAQALQAAACGIEPETRMNPVLLKPSSETGSQVILLGQPLGHMGYGAYSELKEEMLDKIHGAYDDLAGEYDAVIIEGAGSPAEINLKARDVVNMHMAEYADAPVLLVGDIERGGVFASFVGTMELLTEAERARVAGFVINRFRGDASLLVSAIEYMKARTGCPVLGTIPFIRNLGLPEEDSVSLKDRPSRGPTGNPDMLDIAVIDLPHISNFTDFDPFVIEPDVSLRMVRSIDELSSADVIILPGSKNVIEDLEHLRKTGIASRILGLARDQKSICVGICGGYQILGEGIADPSGVESSGGRESRGLGLLGLTTTLRPQKTLVRTEATHIPTGLKASGYEIHHGRTTCDDMSPLWRKEDGEILGTESTDGRIWGTYLHGVFDDDAFRRWFIDEARRSRGMAPAGRILAHFEIDSELDRLSTTVRDSLNMEAIFALLKNR